MGTPRSVIFTLTEASIETRHSEAKLFIQIGPENWSKIVQRGQENFKSMYDLFRCIGQK